MGKGVHRLSLACVLSILTTGCFWEGDSKSNGTRPNTQPDKAEGAVLGIITQWPQDQATQVDAGTSLAVQFDAALNPVSLQDGLTYLEERDTLRRVECDLRLDDSNRTLIIDPIQDLTLETEYVCHLSPLLNDLNQRLLEEDLFFNFKTEDATAPANTSFSIPDGSKNVSRQGVITINFNEAIRAESVTETNVFLRDSNNSNHPIRLDVEANWVVRVVAVPQEYVRLCYGFRSDCLVEVDRDHTLPRDVLRSIGDGERGVCRCGGILGLEVEEQVFFEQSLVQVVE